MGVPNGGNLFQNSTWKLASVRSSKFVKLVISRWVPQSNGLELRTTLKDLQRQLPHQHN